MYKMCDSGSLLRETVQPRNTLMRLEVRQYIAKLRRDHAISINSDIYDIKPRIDPVLITNERATSHESPRDDDGDDSDSDSDSDDDI